MANESHSTAEAGLNQPHRRENATVIHMFWEQKVPDAIVAEERKVDWSDGIGLFQSFIKVGLVCLALVALAISLFIKFEQYHYGNLYGLAITAAVAGLVIYIWRRPRSRDNWFALTNTEAMLFTSRTSREELQDYLDNIQPGASGAADAANLLIGAATLFTDYSAMPTSGADIPNPQKADLLLNYNDITKMELRPGESMIVARSQAPHPASMNIFCQSAAHMDEVLQFLQERCPNAAAATPR